MSKIPGRSVASGATNDPSQGIGMGTTKAQPDIPTQAVLKPGTSGG